MAHQRLAVVTGAAGGIGSAIVRALLPRGFHVVAADVNRSGLEALKSPPASGRGRLTWEVLDVADVSSVRDVSSRIGEEFGGVDVLVNAAGIFLRTPALSLMEDDMGFMMEVNLLGTLRCTAAFGNLMAGLGGRSPAGRTGRIINIASIAGVTGAAMASGYAASKAGVIAATLSAARELASRGISVYCVAPGYCDTPMLQREKPWVDAFVVPRLPLKRLLQPEEVAEVVVFLSTCRTDYMTGTVITMDGGLHLG